MEQLINIYNGLLQIKTNGEDTIVMAQCLIQLKQYIEKERDNDNGNN